MKKLVLLCWSLVAFFNCTMLASANQPTDWGLNFQEAATPAMQRAHDLHHLLLIIIFSITAFVTLLLIITLLRFRASANPTPSKTSHNTIIEIVWTIVPVIILIVIAIPSMKNLYENEKYIEPELTLKSTGFQWYWGFEYGGTEVSFDSIMIPDDEIKEGQVRLLSVDNPVYLPIETNILLQITAADVLHSFSMPSFGIKTDAVPGRINTANLYINKEGTYYGQCAEICGVGHAFMPIEIRAVSKEKFEEWLKAQQ